MELKLWPFKDAVVNTYVMYMHVLLCNQYHLPRPQVDSQWEDCSFRIDTLNIILFTAEGLQEGVKSVQKMIEVDAYDVDAVKSQIGEVLDMLSENLDQMLPPVPEHGFTRYIYCSDNCSCP